MVAQLHASRKMVEKYDQLRAQNKISHRRGHLPPGREEHRPQLRERTAGQDDRGDGKGNGPVPGRVQGRIVARQGVGRNPQEALRQVVPDLYPKLEMGSRPLKGDEAELILKAADLKALPQVFYAGEKGLGLVDQGRAEVRPQPRC